MTSARTLPLVPSRQTFEGGARKHCKMLAGRIWGVEGTYPQAPTATRARSGEGAGGAASALAHEHTLGEALAVDNSCGKV